MFMFNFIMFLLLSFSHNSYADSTTLPDEWKLYQDWALEEQKRFSGWCPQEKAKRIMDVIYNNNSDVCVELGVFGGSSFFPIAATLAKKKQGTAYAIDPWLNNPCLEGYQEGVDQKMFNYWGKIDLEKVMQKFINDMHRNDLEPFYKLIRLTSAEAILLFEDNSIDFLHIDGNHSEQASVADVMLWLPKVKSGGVICFDDAWWESTQKAIKLLLKSCDLMKNISSAKGQYIFLRKR